VNNRSIRQYIAGGIAAAEGYANLNGRAGRTSRRTTGSRPAASARAGRTSGS